MISNEVFWDRWLGEDCSSIPHLSIGLPQVRTSLHATTLLRSVSYQSKNLVWGGERGLFTSITFIQTFPCVQAPWECLRSWKALYEYLIDWLIDCDGINENEYTESNYCIEYMGGGMGDIKRHSNYPAQKIL